MTAALNPMRKWLYVVIGLILYAGIATAAVFGAFTSVHAIGCVNGSLGARNGPSSSDALAHIAYAKAGKKYDDALIAVVTAKPKSARQVAAYTRFVAASRAKSAADTAYIRVLNADQAYRDAHPLGQC